jgi:peptidoglycan hydrolase CwlO-like protein
MAASLAARRNNVEQQLKELEKQPQGSNKLQQQGIKHILAKLQADSASLSQDEQAQIHRALALTERIATRSSKQAAAAAPAAAAAGVSACTAGVSGSTAAPDPLR